MVSGTGRVVYGRDNGAHGVTLSISEAKHTRYSRAGLGASRHARWVRNDGADFTGGTKAMDGLAARPYHPMRCFQSASAWSGLGSIFSW